MFRNTLEPLEWLLYFTRFQTGNFFTYAPLQSWSLYTTNFYDYHILVYSNENARSMVYLMVNWISFHIMHGMDIKVPMHQKKTLNPSFVLRGALRFLIYTILLIKKIILNVKIPFRVLHICTVCLFVYHAD